MSNDELYTGRLLDVIINKELIIESQKEEIKILNDKLLRCSVLVSEMTEKNK